MTSQRERDLEHRLESAESLLAALTLRGQSGLEQSDLDALRRLASVYVTLRLAADPTPGRAPLGGSRGAAAERAYPGAATKYARRILSRLNRKVLGAVRDAETQLDGEWTPPPRCSKCSRSMRFTDRFCGRCGEHVGTRSDHQQSQRVSHESDSQPLSSDPKVRDV